MFSIVLQMKVNVKWWIVFLIGIR